MLFQNLHLAIIKSIWQCAVSFTILILTFVYDGIEIAHHRSVIISFCFSIFLKDALSFHKSHQFLLRCVQYQSYCMV